MSIQDYLSTNIKIYDYRNGGINNPVSIYKTIGSNIFRLILSIEEPSFNGVPVNVLWICTDSKSPWYHKVAIRTSKAPDAGNSTRNTWTEITDDTHLYDSPQTYNLDGAFLLGELLPANSIPYASDTVIGLVQLATAPDDASKPNAVGINDPRMGDARTPTAHTHPLIPSFQLATSSGAINVNTSPVPVIGSVLTVDSTGNNAVFQLLTGSNVLVVPKVLVAITMAGPTTALETDTNLAYTAIAYYDDGTSAPIVPTWSTDNSAVATIDATGKIAAITTILTNASINVLAAYTLNGVTQTASQGLIITHVPKLSSISIAGASTLMEGNTTTYVTTATYNDGTTAIVSPTYSMSAIPGTDTITIDPTGLLHATKVMAPFSGVVNASFTDKGITKTATRTVAFTAIPITLTSVVVSGSTSVFEGSTSQYTLTAYYSNGTNSVITTGEIWSLTTGAHGTLSASGLLTVQALTADAADTVNASYTFGGVTKTSSLAVALKHNAATNITVTGVSTLISAHSSAYTAVLNFLNGSTLDITTLGTWSVTPSGNMNANTYNAPSVSTDTPEVVKITYTTGGTTYTGTIGVTVTAVVTPLQIHWGYSTSGEGRALTAAQIKALQHSVAITSPVTMPYTNQLNSGIYAYFAIPSTYAGAANVQFLDNANNPGGFDGATGDPANGALGPLQVSDTNNGTPFKWYLYTTDYDGDTTTGSIIWTVTF